MMTEIVVITGVAGFLGSHLARSLVNSGRSVLGIDNFISGRRGNVQELLSRPQFMFVEADVTDTDLRKKLDISKISEIYHLASPASPKFYTKYPLETIAANTLGTQNMLEIARASDAKLLYTSTSEVYGDPLVHPQPEDYRGNVNTFGPRACYDESKRLGEVYCYEYYDKYKVLVRVARIFNTYSAGLRSDDGRVISNFVTQALTGQDLTVYGQGDQTRTFCYVDDTIQALVKMMATKKTAGEILNIGGAEEVTILELAQLVQQLTATASKLKFLALPVDDPVQRRPNITKATKLINWKPQVSLTQGLEKTIACYKKLI